MKKNDVKHVEGLSPLNDDVKLNLPKKLIEAKASLHSLQNFPFIPDLSGLQFVLFGNKK
jgi:hypothetical protein